MTNKEWLEQVKKFDEISEFRSDDSSNPYAFRQTKAFEIIAEELIKLNETFDNGLNVTGDINTTGEMDFKGKFEYEK